MNWIVTYIFIFDLLLSVVSGQKCGSKTEVGSLEYGSDIITEDQTFILAGYAVPCDGTVVAWEFCYQKNDAKSVTFYPGIWRIIDTKKNGDTDYKLIQSNNITFTPNGSGDNACQMFNLSVKDQFTVPAGSIVGLYSNKGRKRPQLLFTATDASIRAYKNSGNQNDIKNAGKGRNSMEVDYNVAIKVYLSELKCINLVNILQQGTDTSPIISQVIIPRVNFSCSGRITGYLMSLKNDKSNKRNSEDGNGEDDNKDGDEFNEEDNNKDDESGYPVIQVWRPSSLNSNVYNMVETLCTPTASSISKRFDTIGKEYYLGNVSCTGKDSIEFQSGDIIGYYNANNSNYAVWSIETVDYKFYCDEGSLLTSFNLSNSTVKSYNGQPLIQLIFDLQCINLSTPANGEIMSCSSGRVGVGYEGDTCSFKCITGYELTGSDTRTCQSDGSWNGSDDMCRRVHCPSLTDPDNGVMNCSLGNDNVTSYEDTCSFTCNTGYELTGSDTRTCQSDGSWSGSDDVCRRDTDILVSSDTLIASTISTETVSVMPSTAIIPSSTGTGASDAQMSSSSGSAAIIAGCVAGIVVSIIIITLIILLFWYQRKRRNNKDTQGEVQYVNSQLKNSADGKDFINHQYSVVRDHGRGMVTVKNADYEATDNCGYYSSVDRMNGESNGKPTEASPYMDPVNTTTIDHFKMIDRPGYYSSLDNDSNKLSEAMPYMDPIRTIINNHPKASGDDYETLPVLSMYEKPDCMTPYQYEVATDTAAFRNSMEDNTLGETLLDNEQIYEDPGHNKEKIYSWFEEKKFRKIGGSDIKISQKLGSGQFGTVHLGLWSNGSTDPVQIAVKTLNSQCSESDRVKFLREAAVMGQFVHNNVVQLHGVVTEEENMMIVLEYMSKGNLQNFLKTITSPDAYNNLKHDLLNFCRQIAAGMNYLANKQFVHRDLAARNILVSSDDVCKIADFGMARDVADDTYYITSGGKIPVKWTAPEAIFYKKYSTKSDVWSFGCVMYEIWSLGHKPFEDFNGKEYLHKITTGYRLPPPPGCPRAIYELMIQCWHPTTKSRPTSGSTSQTLQKSDRALLTSSVQVTDDDVTPESQSMMLGAPLTAGCRLYLDLQQRYINKSS